jgi:queuine tRNA-ribosyltransferase
MNPDPVSAFRFTLLRTDGAARLGELETPHGVVHTPAFMPVGTQGAVKGTLFKDLEETGAEIVLGNTYHLHLRPGDELIGRLGGLHRFIGWDRPILTDSGGYQVFSLAERRRITEDGAEFQSHIDGSRHHLSPESAVDIQARLGSDVAMVLDECHAYPATRDEAAESMQRSVRWAQRCRNRLQRLRSSAPAEVIVSNAGQAQFGIVRSVASASGSPSRSCTKSWNRPLAGCPRHNLDTSWGQAHRKTSWKAWLEASTCSTASSRHGTPGTDSSSPARDV